MRYFKAQSSITAVDGYHRIIAIVEIERGNEVEMLQVGALY